MAGCSLGNSKRGWLYRKMFHLFPQHVGEERDTELPLKWQSSTFLWFVRMHERVLSKSKCVLTAKMVVTITKITYIVEICNRYLTGLRFITVTLRVLHNYPLGSLALPGVVQDIPRGAGFQAAALQKHKCALQLFCWETKSISLLLFENSENVPDSITWGMSECEISEAEAVESVS